MKQSKFKRISAACIAAAMLMGFAGCHAELPETAQDTNTSETAKIDFANISAKDDFFGYANGEALGFADITNNYEYAGAFGKVYSNTEDIVYDSIRKIVSSNEEFEYGSKEWIIKHVYDEYSASLDEEYMQSYYESEFEDVNGELEKIMNAKTSEELVSLCIKNKVGIYPVFKLAVNVFDPTNYCYEVELYKKILGVQFYEINEDTNAVANNNSMYVDVFKALGDDEDTARDKVLAFEYLAIDLCWSTETDRVSSLDWNTEYFTHVSNDELSKIFTNFDYEAVEKAYELDELIDDGWYCYSTEQLKGINACYSDENLEALRNLAIADYCIANAEVLSLKYDDLSSGYSFSGDKEYKVLYEITRNMSFYHFVEKLYVESAYDEEADRVLRSMCDDVVGGYRDIISQAEWLTPETRQKLIEKLDNIIFLTAKDLDCDEIDTEVADCFTGDYYKTLENLNELNLRREKEKYLNGVNREALQFGMHEVNACYDAMLNNVTICLAIQSYPFFSKDESYAYNLAFLGATIAHEIGHAFDSEGILFDKDGVYNPGWLSPEDIAALEQRNQEAIHYFETAFKVYNIYTIDGEQTLGENYADLGGAEVCVSLLDSKEEYEEFFECYAMSWASIITVNSLKQQIKYDVHSPEILRTNAIVACLDEFYETYDVKPGDGMYIAPEDRVSRWY